MYSEIEYRNAIINYRDKHKLINPKKVFHTAADETGNGLMYSAIHLILLKINDWVTFNDKSEFLDKLYFCQTSVASCILKRSPTKTDQNGWDDYIAVLSALHMNDMLGTTHEFLVKGKEYKFNFNNETPNKFTFKSWFGRSPRFVAHMYFCAEKEPNIFLKICWCLQMLLATLSKKTHFNSWALGYLYCMPLLNRFDMCGMVAKFYMRVLRKKLDNENDVFVNILEDKEHVFAKVKTI